jgi:predicted ABC-type transport system involved in lysophospholipase L1 biosynthesis ATPase subunit/GNAT superfamily N-acetyltransferase
MSGTGELSPRCKEPVVQATVVRETAVERTPRVLKLEGLFDIPPSQRSSQRWEVDLDLPDAWNVGLIVGPSGSGKSTIARELFGDRLVSAWDWPSDQSILDGFPTAMGIKEITELLSSVGFSSPPSWVRPYRALSNGEQFRANLARTLAEMPELAVVDEFTSVVDRTVAQIGAAAVAQTVRRRGQKFIAVTCHYDVADWLDPDWVFQPHTGRLERRLLRGRPRLELEIARVHRQAWQLFRAHHYLSGDLHKAAVCFVAFLAGRPAAFCAVLSFPHPTHPGWREHRTVCLPDFQGVGIGSSLAEYVAGLYKATGKPYRSTTSHPGYIRHRARSKLWRMIREPSLIPRSKRTSIYQAASINRLTSSFEYVGPAHAVDASRFGIAVYEGPSCRVADRRS